MEGKLIKAELEEKKAINHTCPRHLENGLCLISMNDLTGADTGFQKGGGSG